jgi:histidyl-tRNA synthetase
VTQDKRDPRSIAAVKGTKDILPDEVGRWQAVEAAVRRVVELYGYRELRAPVIEPTELFEKGTGETSDIVIKEMYTFTDKGGRSITLRPEYTPSVVRAIIEHRLDLLPEPLRYYYVGPMFRYDKPQKGRYRQFHQVDVEVFGEKDAAIDAELVEMADRLLRELGVAGTETLINSVGCRACRPDYLRLLREKADAVKARLCEDCRRKAETNPLRIFDCKIEGCREAAAGFPVVADHLCAECASHFAAFKAGLDLYGLAYRVEPRLVRGIDYYTKTAFEVAAPGLGAQSAVLGGGRYDDLMKDYGGPDLCAIGFAMGVERLLSVADVKTARTPFVYLAYIGDEAKAAGMETARRLRAQGVECLVEYKDKGLKAQLGRASKLGAAWAVIIGEEEVRKGRFAVKSLATGAQHEAAPDDVLRIIRG